MDSPTNGLVAITNGLSLPETPYALRCLIDAREEGVKKLQNLT